jgi:hypothetical protein
METSQSSMFPMRPRLTPIASTIAVRYPALSTLPALEANGEDSCSGKIETADIQPTSSQAMFGRLVISASVTDLKQAPLDPKLLVPPAGAIERRQCPDKKEAEELIHPMPELDPGRHDWVELDTELTVLTDGNVGKVGIVGRADSAHGGLAIEMLKKWKFKPAMCGAEPVVSDIYGSFDYGNTVIR